LSARESAAPVERPGDRGVTAGTVTSNSTVQSMDDPRIRPGHVLDIRVVVSGVTEVDESAKRVSSTGHLSLVLVGKVDVNGLTLPQLADRLEKLYGRYMREPMVDVSFVVDQSPGAVSPWGYVTVLGSVKHPGRINIPPTQDLTLSMAVQLAGGLGESARDTAIKVTRRNGADPAATLNVNLRSAASEGAVENDLPLQAGDVIYVPEKVF
jgi:protein involved in polysaccharide export with SLBB domain